jgi:hypothetical protein
MFCENTTSCRGVNRIQEVELARGVTGGGGGWEAPRFQTVENPQYLNLLNDSVLSPDSSQKLGLEWPQRFFAELISFRETSIQNLSVGVTKRRWNI